MYNKLRNRENFMMKFDDNSHDSNGVLRPGWATPTFEGFFTRAVDTPVLLEQSRTVPMTSEQHNLDDLNAEVELDAQRNVSTGVSVGLTSNETNPRLTGKRLVAQPLQAKSIVYDNFIDENIEGDDFMTLWTNHLAEACGPAFERWALYADTTVSHVSGEGTGYGMTNGIIAQAKAISTNNDIDAYGLAKLTYQDNIGEGLFNAILRYIDQDGDVSGCTMVLPTIVYSRFVAEVAQNRETDWTDQVMQDGGVYSLMNIPIKQDNVLRETRNGYDTMKFTNGEYKGNGTNTSYMKYGVLGKAENLCVGMMNNIEAKSQYDIDIWGYKIGMRVKGDAKIHQDQDTLVLPFTMQNTPTG